MGPVVDGARGPRAPEPQGAIERRPATVSRRRQNGRTLVLEGEREGAGLTRARHEVRAGTGAVHPERLLPQQGQESVSRMAADAEEAAVGEVHLPARKARTRLEDDLEGHLAPLAGEDPDQLVIG